MGPGTSVKPRPATPRFIDPLGLLTDFERRTAGTGGISLIRKGKSLDPRALFAVSMEGTLLPPLHRGSRTTGNVGPRAPNFNKLFLRTKQNASDLRKTYPNIGSYQMSHLWGPGFGDEAAAGMMWAPATLNLELQNRYIEQFIREAAEAARQGAGEVRLKATALAWDRGTNVAEFLFQAEYEMTLQGRDGGYEKFTIDVEALPPGTPGIRTFSVRNWTGT